jgi:hypothetical protein
MKFDKLKLGHTWERVFIIWQIKTIKYIKFHQMFIHFGFFWQKQNDIIGGKSKFTNIKDVYTILTAYLVKNICPYHHVQI